MKGIYKGVKYTLSQIFVVKEPEIEIGLPTDVKHVAHIGWDGSTGSAPAWMNKFNAVPEYAVASIGNSGSALSPWSNKDSLEATTETVLPPSKKKGRRKKCKPTSSTENSIRSSWRGKSKTKYIEESAQPADIEVA